MLAAEHSKGEFALWSRCRVYNKMRWLACAGGRVPAADNKTRTWSTMGATWYLGEPMLRNQSHALSACGTGVRGTLGVAAMLLLSLSDDARFTIQ